MKKLLILVILPCSLGVNAQIDSTNALTDTSQIKFIEPPDSTGFGTPDGQLVSKEIGPAGGTIISDDGRVELIFPPDALTANTNISIQPTTNPAPNGAGKAYQFEPSGIQFKKPVQIIFHYTDEEAETCPPELMGLAMQDHVGKWSFFDYDDWDSLTKVLKGYLHHFSSISKVYKLQLYLEKDEVFVNDKVSIEILDISRKPTIPGWSLAFEYATFSKKAPLLWYVNGIENGNRFVGQMMTETYPIGRTNITAAYFYAPNQLPMKNPVTVRLDVYVFSGKKKVSNRALSLTCKIQIYDEYKVTVYMNLGGAIMQWIDRSSFTLKIGDHAEIVNGSIQNMLLKVEQSGQCKAEYKNEATCEGLINVKGIATANLVPATSAGGYTRVNITFQPAAASLPILDFSRCPGAKEKNPPFSGNHAFPVLMAFELKNEQQFLSLAKLNGAIVKKPDPHDVTAIIEPVRQ